jgi:hypothetical protein
MPWRYHQRTGELTHNGQRIGRGYSGAQPNGYNNPQTEGIRNIGPIPRGNYRIGNPRNTQTHGPHAMDLTPVGHNALGRDGFMIHGDRRTGLPGRASTGCIILNRQIREQISRSGDHTLIVEW